MELLYMLIHIGQNTPLYFDASSATVMEEDNEDEGMARGHEATTRGGLRAGVSARACGGGTELEQAARGKRERKGEEPVRWKEIYRD